MKRSAALSCALLLCGLAAGRAEEPVSFRRDVAPILLENCVACHGPKKAEGGYRVDTFDELGKPGDSGEAPLAAEAGGELLRRIASADPSERMPADAEPLPAEQIGIVRRWIAAGAAFDGDRANDPLYLAIPPARYPPPPTSYAMPVPVTALAFSPDSSQLLVGGYHELTVWNVADGTLARRMQDLPQRVFTLAFLASGRLAVGGGEPGRSGEVRLVDFASGSVEAVAARTTDVVLDLAVRRGHGQLAVASADGLIRIIDSETSATLRTIASHADWVTAVAWSDDGALLASASRDKSAKLYAGETGDLLANYQGHGAAVRGVAFLPDGKQVFSTGADGKLHRWNVEGAGKVAEVGLGGEAFHITRTPGVLLVPGADSNVRQVNLSDNAVTRTLAGHRDWVLSVAVSPDGSRFASGSLDGEVRLWNAADGALVRAWTAKP